MQDKQVLWRRRRSLAVLVVIAAVAILFAMYSRGWPGTTIALSSGPSPSGPVLCPLAQILPFTLVGDPKADPPVWGVTKPDGQRFEIAWPYGFSAHFDFVGVEILDPSGWIVARGGLITDAGGGGDDPTTICSLGSNVW